MQFRSLVLSAVVVPFVSGQALAAGEVKFQFNQGLLNYSDISSTSTPDGGTATTAKTSKMETMPSDLEIVAQFGGMHLHFSPTDESAALGFGYDIMPELEVGLHFSMDSKKVDKPTADETSSSKYGLFAKKTIGLTGQSLEVNFSFDLLSESSKSTNTATTTTAAVETKGDTSGTVIQFGASYLRPIAGTLSYVGGFDYAMASADSKSSSAGLESKVKTSASGFQLRLLGVRFVL